MDPLLHVHLLPALVEPEELAASTVVVIDVLRASTTINQALAEGATAVIPCLEVEEARRIAANLPTGLAVLGGEREGLRIPNFDLGNSPSEYRPETVAGKTVVFTTTNGTRAMMACRAARRVLVGAFVNWSAVCKILPEGGPIHLLCSGTRGRITREDALFAGAVVERLLALEVVDELALNDQASLARAAWRDAAGSERAAAKGPSPAVLAAQLRLTNGGRNLKGIGLERDIDDAARIDLLNLVAEVDLESWRIVPAKSV